MRRRSFLTLAAAGPLAALGGRGTGAQGRKLFDRENLVAWCIVPFDAKRRNPEERAEMLERLGIRRLAYDWRAEHVPQFDRELDALNARGIRLEAFWFPCGPEPEKETDVRTILELLGRRKIRTQLWLSTGVPEQGRTQEQKVETAARTVRHAAEKAREIGCKVALYNHGGWFGEPENQVQVVRQVAMPNVGIVYNFHHGHPHIDRFPELFRLMQPHLLALNINGMRKEGPKILSVGRGDRELEMLQVVAKSGWRGPVGILGHREEMDAEVALRESLEGLAALRERLLT